MRFVIILLLIGYITLPAQSDQEEWIQLFNGKNLDGWTVKIRGQEVGENYLNTFQVEDGVMKVGYEGYDAFDEQFGHIFYQDPFSYYRLRVEYRFAGEQAPEGPDWAWRNSGIMVHGQDPATMGIDQDFPISIEVQLLGAPEEGTRTTANLCTPGTHVVIDGKLITQHCINSTSKSYRGDQWVVAEVLVLGNSIIQHFVKGEKVHEYLMPQVGGGVVNQFDETMKQDGALLSSGTISLQSESHPVEFRQVELLNLAGCMDPEAQNYKSCIWPEMPSTHDTCGISLVITYR